MKQVVLKQNVGIDISKNGFAVAFMYLLDNQRVKIKGTRSFSNNEKGFSEFLNWCSKFQIKGLSLHFTMEATGVYYEQLAYFLNQKRFIIHVVLPNMAKKFAQSYNQKIKTDKADAKVLAIMGIERNLRIWKPSSAIYRKLRALTRERELLIVERTKIKNQLHSQEHSVNAARTTIARMKEHIKYINKLLEKIEKELYKESKKDQLVWNKIEKIISIPGVSFITAITIIAETQGFVNIRNIKQLISYAGYDVSIKESGKWKGKSRISKKGNSHIRRVLYMPAIVSVRYSEHFNNFYNRVNKNKVSTMIGATAVQRKLLALIYTLWKNNTTYNEKIQNVKLVA